MIDLAEIRARDALVRFMDYATAGDADRRALLAAYDALAAENAALKAQFAYAASTGDECAIEVEALRKDAQCYHHLVGLIRANRTAFAGEVLDWFTGESHE